MITRLPAFCPRPPPSSRGSVRADTGYHDKVIKMYVPGGRRTDRWLARCSPEDQTAVGQGVIIDNRPGAAARWARGHLAAAEPDGYSLFSAIPPRSR